MIYVFFAIVAIIVGVVVWKARRNKRLLNKVYPSYLEERRKKQELLDICKQMRGQAWLHLQKEKWPEFVIHGEKIKAPDRKAAIHKYNQSHK